MGRKKREKLENQYQERLPEEILKELTPEVRRQYFLWDEIMKREIQLYPELMLPVVREIFHKEYPDDRSIALLSTEYTVSRVYEEGQKLLQAIRSDILLKIAGDLYHFECQIEKDGKMVFRMFEYDASIALTHGKKVQEAEGRPEKFAVSFPRSAILYLGNKKNLPEYETCELCFPDGAKHLYQVPVMRVQEYGLKEIEEKHLDIMIPFLPIRFRDRIKKVPEKDREKNREETRSDLMGFLAECFAILDREMERAFITEMIRKDIEEFLWKTCSYLLEEDREMLIRINADHMEPAIKLSREVIDELHREAEASCRRLIEKSLNEGKTAEETEADLIAVFALPEETAREKMKLYWKEK